MSLPIPEFEVLVATPEKCVEHIYFACSVLFQFFAAKMGAKSDPKTLSHPPARVRQAIIAGVMKQIFVELDASLNPDKIPEIIQKVNIDSEDRYENAYGKADLEEQLVPVDRYFGEERLYMDLRSNWDNRIRPLLEHYAHTELVVSKYGQVSDE